MTQTNQQIAQELLNVLGNSEHHNTAWVLKEVIEKLVDLAIPDEPRPGLSQFIGDTEIGEWVISQSFRRKFLEICNELEMTDEPIQYKIPMTEVEEIKAQIKVLESKLEFYKELEKTKTPCEEAYKKVYGGYPDTSTDDYCEYYDITWRHFSRGYNAAQEDYKVKEYQEPTKDKVSLHKRFENEGAYGKLHYDYDYTTKISTE